MRSIYWLLGIVLAFLAAINILGVVGVVAEWWNAGRGNVKSGIRWAILLGGLSAASFIRVYMLRPRPAQEPACPKCGYNLSGTPQHCPECGWNG